MTIYRGPGGSGDATNDATVTAVASYAAQAATSATNAANSATTSGTSATNSANSASSAAASASAAATSASQAASSQSAAATSATTAANSATSAGTQATTATTQANNAANSATAAAASAASASTSASNASTSATNAASSATNSANSAASALAIYGNTTAMNTAVTNAANSASAAATSASQAAASSGTASDYATQAGISAGLAGNSASDAANSASSAATSAFNATQAANTSTGIYGSLVAVQTAAASATASANSASTSATNAANSATQAANSAASAAAIVTGVASNRPSVRPSLLLDFSNTKQLDPRITFSRPTTATYYDGKTVVKAEENLLTQSQAFDSSDWFQLGFAVTANATNAPDGTATAESVNEGTTTNYHIVYQSKSIVAGNSYVFSSYAKASTGQYIYLSVNAGSALFAVAVFDILNGTLIGSTAVGSGWSVNSAAIISAGSGWYRCSLSFVSGSTYSTAAFSIGNSNTSTIPASGSSGLISYTGTSLVNYLWGAQLEQRSTVTAYTPTTTAPITNYIPVLQTAVSNDARFDHDPVTGESKGLLIEEQRTNLLTYSEQFDNAVWGKGNSTVTANAMIAPDGTLTADKLSEDTTAATHFMERSISIVTGTAYTYSAYIKWAGNTSRNIKLTPIGSTAVGGNAGVIFNNSGVYVATQGTGTITSYSITNVGNGWYRVSATMTSSSAGTAYPTIALTDGINVSYTGDGYSGIYIWGAQLEAGSFPTSYIPTVASQVTRSADSASMTGSNFSSWYRADEGTLYAEAIGNSTSIANQFIVQASDGSNNNQITLSRSLGNLVTEGGFFVRANATAQALLYNSQGSWPTGSTAKLTGAYKVNDFSESLNAASVLTDTSGSIPNVTQLTIGSAVDGTVKLNGTIKRIAYYPKRLSNQELMGLTS